MREQISKIDRLRNELERAREKANECLARVRDLEKQIIECENMEIIRTVRSMAVSPENLKSLLMQFQSSSPSDEPVSQEVPTQTGEPHAGDIDIGQESSKNKEEEA